MTNQICLEAKISQFEIEQEFENGEKTANAVISQKRIIIYSFLSYRLKIEVITKHTI